MCENVGLPETSVSLFPVLLIPAKRTIPASGGGGFGGGFGVLKNYLPVLLIPVTKLS